MIELRAVTLEQEAVERAAVVREAREWIGTPYRSAQRVKGHAGGVDCLTFIVEVYERCGLIPKIKLPYYSQLWHLSQYEERYMNAIATYAREVEKPGIGDIFIVKIGLAFSHGAIITEWPNVIHAFMGRGVLSTDASNDGHIIGRPQKFFSFWK